MTTIATDSDRPWLKNYEPGVPSTITCPDMTLGAVLNQSATKFPDQSAVFFYGKRISYAELDGLANQFCRSLLRLGVKKGDRVALMLPNVPQMVICYFGTLRTGAMAVLTNPLYHEHELETQLKDSGAETLVALDLFLPVITNVLKKTKVKHLILCSVKDYLSFPKNFLYSLKMRSKIQPPPADLASQTFGLVKLMGREETAPAEEVVSPDDVAVVQYTGGTTGIPKGAMLTHRNLLVNAIQTRSWFTKQKEGKDRLLAVIPFFHVYGLTVALNEGILAGVELILLPKFHTKEVLRYIHKYRPKVFPGVQAMYLAIGNYPKTHKYDLTSVEVALSGAGPLMREVQERFEHLTKSRIVEGYGLSEASPVTHANPIFGMRKIGSIGLPWPQTEARIVDRETGKKVLPVGESGELVIRGPQVMKGYWNKPEETAHVLRDGWLHTGDIAKMDEDGFFFIVDRMKDMIKTGGENVYPREVEEVLYKHPRVREAVVVGIPNDFLGEQIKAYIVLNEEKPSEDTLNTQASDGTDHKHNVSQEGEKAAADEIIEFCKEHISKFKVPKEIEFRSEIPKTSVGKVLRRTLRDEEMKKRAMQKQ
ncbi:MAG TPA: long-chain fatty acid--CoA ligase [Nitrospirota bacterium]|nr:long-chain fatty acid--CoA ligase [Nitrospirota bacterium]